jgi:hypothetical protein
VDSRTVKLAGFYNDFYLLYQAVQKTSFLNNQKTFHLHLHSDDCLFEGNNPRACEEQRGEGKGRSWEIRVYVAMDFWKAGQQHAANQSPSVEGKRAAGSAGGEGGGGNANADDSWGTTALTRINQWRDMLVTSSGFFRTSSKDTPKGCCPCPGFSPSNHPFTARSTDRHITSSTLGALPMLDRTAAASG